MEFDTVWTGATWRDEVPLAPVVPEPSAQAIGAVQKAPGQRIEAHVCAELASRGPRTLKQLQIGTRYSQTGILYAVHRLRQRGALVAVGLVRGKGNRRSAIVYALPTPRELSTRDATAALSQAVQRRARQLKVAGR